MKVKVGVFWFCNFDLLYDIEEIEIDDSSRELYAYTKQHQDVWYSLSKNQFNGKYSAYPYDFFQRGRIYYNSANKKHSIVMNDLRKDIPKLFSDKLHDIFNFK